MSHIYSVTTAVAFGGMYVCLATHALHWCKLIFDVHDFLRLVKTLVLNVQSCVLGDVDLF